MSWMSGTMKSQTMNKVETDVFDWYYDMPQELWEEAIDLLITSGMQYGEYTKQLIVEKASEIRDNE
jgi:hypothetical protein